MDPGSQKDGIQKNPSHFGKTIFNLFEAMLSSKLIFMIQLFRGTLQKSQYPAGFRIPGGAWIRKKPQSHQSIMNSIELEYFN